MLPRPLRIAHLAGTPSGAPWLVAIIREQRRRGHEAMAVIPGREGTLAPIFEAEAIPYHVMPLMSTFTRFSSSNCSKWLIWSYRLDQTGFGTRSFTRTISTSS